MVKKVIRLHKQFREEWTKYFVNGIECKRDTIYKTILDNKLHNSEITIEKKYHFEARERKKIVVKEKSEQTVAQGPTTIYQKSESRKRNIDEKSHHTNNAVNFNCDTSNFCKKFKPTSREYKLLIHRMINVVDWLYDTTENYKRNAESLRESMRIFMHMLVSKNEPQTLYDDIMCKVSSELLTFVLDKLAFALYLSKADDFSFDIPSLAFDLKDVAHRWDESGTNKQKSDYLKIYLSALLRETDVIHQLWSKHELCANESIRNEINDGFNQFKKFLYTMRDKIIACDVCLLTKDKVVASGSSSFFYQQSSGKSVNSSLSNQFSPSFG